jgi:hypothetical protein
VISRRPDLTRIDTSSKRQPWHQYSRESNDMMPPHRVLARLAWEVLTTPPTDEEIHLLTEVVEEAQEQNLEPA